MFKIINPLFYVLNDFHKAGSRGLKAHKDPPVGGDEVPQSGGAQGKNQKEVASEGK